MLYGIHDDKVTPRNFNSPQQNTIKREKPTLGHRDFTELLKQKANYKMIL